MTHCNTLPALLEPTALDGSGTLRRFTCPRKNAYLSGQLALRARMELRQADFSRVSRTEAMIAFADPALGTKRDSFDFDATDHLPTKETIVRENGVRCRYHQDGTVRRVIQCEEHGC